ncbi:hypothetical protein DFH27DRAFT_656507 [Peziza echinospora]|nr:hypothetical protein DFH27DRAFT_656507 [Peziza echinospora]
MSTTDIDWIGGVCRQKTHSSVVLDKKIYVLGGTTWQLFPARFNLSSPYTSQGIAATHLRILDFSKSFTTTPTASTIESVKRIPDSVALTQFTMLYPSASDKKVHMFGGQPTYHPPLTDSGAGSAGGRQLLGNTVWTFDVATGQWATVANANVRDHPTGYAASTYDPATSRGWIFAGTYERLGYFTYPTDPAKMSLRDYSTATWTPLGPTVPGGANFYKDWISEYHQLALGSGVGFANITAPPIPPQAMHGMKSVYLPPNNRRGEGNGTVLTFGGIETTAGSSRIPFRDAYIFDPAQQEWYTQPLTAENGNFPSARWEFCAQAAQAADGSSWNIYVYGGAADAGKTVLQDLYILTVPAFHWVYIGAYGSRYQHTCDVVDKDDRYMAVYRGVAVASPPGDCTPGAGGDDGGGLSILDMTDLVWTRKYVVDRKYEVPKKISAVIGGNATGGATLLTPKSGFVSDSLAALYKWDPPTVLPDTTTPSGSGTSGPKPTGTSAPNSSSSKTPTGAIAGGVVGGIALLLIILLAFILLRRRRRRTQLAAPMHHAYPTELPVPAGGGYTDQQQGGMGMYAGGGGAGYPQQYHGQPPVVPVGELDNTTASNKTVMEHYHPNGLNGDAQVDPYANAVAPQQGQMYPGELYTDTTGTSQGGRPSTGTSRHPG